MSGNLEKTRAASLSNPKMRPAKSSVNIASAAASSPPRRLPLVSNSIPQKISASVIDVVKSSVAGCFATHVTTRADGLGLMSSESTSVSRMIIRQILGPGG